MQLTVEDLIKLPEFKGMRLIAGKDGLSNVVKDCGILDYEYDSNVKEKYSHTNFKSQQLVLTSFLYAKNNEYLVMDAVKKLISRNCSGLAVRNIFRLPFHDNLLRYADSMKFPIFLIEDPELYFEDMIFTVKTLANRYASFHYRAEKVDALLKLSQEGADDQQLVALAREIHPSLDSDFAVLCFRSRNTLEEKDYFEFSSLYYHAQLLGAGTSVFYYKNGFIIIHSCEMFSSGDVHQVAAPYLTVLGDRLKEFYIGVSRLHHKLPEFTEGIREGLYAMTAHQIDPTPDYLAFDEIGVYQFILPFADRPYLRRFSETYVGPLRDYDAENKTELLSTAIAFVLHGGSIDRAAEALGQHKNTVRYRLDRASKLYGQNILKLEHYEKLSLAVKIHLSLDQVE